ncbi:unnamed protein product [Orchesella dallaii]|uniref:F-box domain-containing protein n=1 Tax=Orchesella dallaii TaxID=48710 RepID=A0ABP1QKT7_9HEXA
MPSHYLNGREKPEPARTNSPNSNRSPRITSSGSPLRRSVRVRTDSVLGSAPPSSRTGGSRLNPNTGPIIMTKAQLRRRNAQLAATNKIRTVTPGETNSGPTVTTRTLAYTNGKPRVERSVALKPIIISNTPAKIGTLNVSSDVAPTTATILQPRVSITPSGRPASVDTFSISSGKLRRSRNRVSFALPEPNERNSVFKVLTSEKTLPRILSFMNWNELLPLRIVCKTWFEIIESHPLVKANLGIINLRPEAESKMAIYNTSSVTWNKFRFIGPIIFDMTKPIQNEFWSKHGPLMVHLEINNRTMTLTGLVEILARCPKLEVFKCNWTPEMYSFNSELIKKYYGIHFNNGTFANLQDLTIECSASLTDSALWSILKWCGGSVRYTVYIIFKLCIYMIFLIWITFQDIFEIFRSLTLTSPPDADVLTRLKPRWSIDSIKNYFERFGYTGMLQYLDFSWSNLTPDDIRSLSNVEMTLKGLCLNYCKVDDDSMRKLLLKHGATLEILKIEGTSFTDAIFGREILPKVKVLHIGGMKGTVQSINFLTEMPCLEELSCHKTQWLEQSMILRPFNSKSRHRFMKSIDFGGGIKHSGNKKLDPNLNTNWFSDFTGLVSHVKELNLGQWSLFGTDLNFRNICQTLTLLEKLVLQDWEKLTDVGTTGLYAEEIHQDWGTNLPTRPRVYLGLLKRLKVLDLSGTAITDATVNLALYSLKNLRCLAIENTRVTDAGLRGLINKLQSLDRISVTKCSSISVSQPRLKRPDGRMIFFAKI